MFISKEEKEELFREISQIKSVIGFVPADRSWSFFGTDAKSRKIELLIKDIEDLQRELKMLEGYLGVVRKQGSFDKLEKADDLTFPTVLNHTAGSGYKANKSK